LEAAFLDTDIGSYVMQMYNARWPIVICLLLSLFFSLSYIKFMDWCAFTLSWISVILLQVSLISIGVLAFFERKNILETQTDYNKTTVTALEWTVWISWILAAVYCMIMACNFKSLRVSIAIIETAADYFADTKRIVLVPLLYFCIGVAIFLMWIYGVVCVASIGPITVDSISLQRKSVTNPEGTSWQLAGMAFGFLWIAAMLISMCEYVVIVSSSTWYFSRKDIPDSDGIPGDSDVWKGFWWSLRYNYGSLAFGSFILAVVWAIRVVFEYVGHKVQEASGDNDCTRCLLASIRCCLDCFDRFVRFLNCNAYIYMAVSGDSFCQSALHSFLLILKNSAKFGFVNGIATVFMFLAKFTVAIATTLCCWGLLKTWPEQEEVSGRKEGVLLPCLFVFIFAYIVASVFIGIFDISSATILQCYLKDLDISRQANLEPTHVPETLAKFLTIHTAGKIDGEATVARRKSSQASANDEQNERFLE
jgi:solute carrier family 44 (choline transporter-like protein), member 2/4/5